VSPRPHERQQGSTSSTLRRPPPSHSSSVCGRQPNQSRAARMRDSDTDRLWLAPRREVKRITRPSRSGLRSVFAGQHTVRAVSSCKTGALPTEQRPRVYLSNAEASSSTPLVQLITLQHLRAQPACETKARALPQERGDVRATVTSFLRHLRAGNASGRTIQEILRGMPGGPRHGGTHHT
jgi:hypothetical protein